MDVSDNIRRDGKEPVSLGKRLEPTQNVLKVATFAITLTVALGTPASIMQYTDLGLPVQLLTRGEMVKAGILPTIALGLLSLIAYLLAKTRIVKDRIDTKALPIAFRAFINSITSIYVVYGWSIVGLYVLRTLHLQYGQGWHAALHVGWKIRIILTVILVPSVWVGIKVAKLVNRVFATASKTHTRFYSAIIIAASIFAVSLALIVRFGEKQRGTNLDPFVDIAAAAVFATLIISFGPLFTGMRSAGRASGSRQMAIFVGVTYLFAVIFYSVSWYSRIPQFLGGGKPFPVAIWIAKDQPTETLTNESRSCTSTVDNWIRCDHAYLITLNAEYCIISLEQATGSRAYALRKTAVSTISIAR